VSTALGVSSAQAVWAFATAVGLAALLAASEPAFLALRIAGAAYLVWLGLQSLVAAWRGNARRGATCGDAHALGLPAGVLSNLGNPKMAVFFTGLLPQFAGSFAGLLALGALFSLLTLGWLSAYAVAVGRVGHLLRRPAVRRALDALTGAVLIALGLRLATERR
jgi:threonine/homoserine/homoserine lactone efflux protein